MRTLLTGSGYDMIEAADGQAGVAQAKAAQPDLILMDIQMPIVDGYEATRQIKPDPGLKATPIIAVRVSVTTCWRWQVQQGGCTSRPLPR